MYDIAGITLEGDACANIKAHFFFSKRPLILKSRGHFAMKRFRETNQILFV